MTPFRFEVAINAVPKIDTDFLRQRIKYAVEKELATINEIAPCKETPWVSEKVAVFDNNA